jgi:GT2 family glycosyltransferase
LLRAITSVPEAAITVSDTDLPDAIWSGSSWEALQHSREVLGSRVSRQPVPPQDATVMVLGDPFAPPDHSEIDLREQGVPVVVPSGSVAQVMWPDAPTWDRADDLAAILSGAAGVAPSTSLKASPRRTVSPAPERARAVSAAIPVFRDVRFLAECVESLMAQEQPPVELLLVDDGSASDDVTRALAAMADGSAMIRVLTTEHRGVCAARNIAIEAMSGDSFVLVDSDDVLEPTFISTCAEVMRGSSDVWAVATWTEFFGEYEAIEAKPPFDVRVGLRENPIISTPVLVDMIARDKGIRFAEDLAFLYCEDWHFWSQIVAAGGRFGLVPQPLARHRVHPSSGGYLRTELAHAVGRSRATEPLRRQRN